MTGWSDIIAGTAMTLINDVRWRKNWRADPAQFFRAKSQYVSLALPMLSRPPELLAYLQAGMAPPQWADQEWTSTPESTTQETAISTGLLGFDLFSCSIISPGTGSVQPYRDAAYDPVTGDRDVPAAERGGNHLLAGFLHRRAVPSPDALADAAFWPGGGDCMGRAV